MLRSNLLLSLLTPTLDGLLSADLLPSRLYGAEFVDTSGPGRDRKKREEVIAMETVSFVSI